MEDPKDRSFLGLSFQATDSEWNDLLLDMYAEPVWREWAILDYQVQQGQFGATPKEGRDLCEKLTDYDLAVRTAFRRKLDVLNATRSDFS
jgi:hypothetical protein